MLPQKEWLGYRHDSSSMVNIPGSTPVLAQYIYFHLYNIKTYMYYVLKIYSIMKEALVIFDVVLA